MRIGITFDLRSHYLAQGYSDEETAEFDHGDTIDAIEQALKSLGYQTDRIGNVQDLIKRLAAGDRWNLVFNVCEGLHGYGREAQVPAVLEAYGIAYTFSDTLTSSLTLHKGLTKNVLRDNGIATSDFAVIENVTQLSNLKLALPVFAKPIAEGTGKGIDAGSRITNRAKLKTVCAHLLKHYRQAVLVEPFLPGKEYTVGIIGTGEQARALGTLEVQLLDGADQDAYTYANKEACETRIHYALVDQGAMRLELEALALATWRCLNCRDGGRVDLRLDANDKPQVLEINPLAGLHPTHSDLPILCSQLGVPYVTLINWIVTSALARVDVVKRKDKTTRAAHA